MSTLRSLLLRNLSTQPIVGALTAALTLACGCSAQSHLETNYADTNTVDARLYLFGDPLGFRSALAHKGIAFIFESITDAMGVVHGGLSDQPAAYTRVRGTVDIDFGRLTGTDNGFSFHATGLWQTGDNIGSKLGSYADPSGFASVHVFRMDSFWLQKQFDDGAVTLRAGQMAGWDFFGNQECGGSFTIESLSYAPGNIFSATYLTFNPAGVPAAYVRLQSFRRNESPVRGVYAKAAVFSGNKNPYQQDPTGLRYVFANSPVIASEAGYLWDTPTDPDQAPPADRKVYPGIYRFGGIVNYNGLFTNPLTGQVTKGSYLYYFMAAQAVYRAEAGSNRGLDVTFAYNNSPNSTSQQNSMITAGAVYHGIIPRRTMDQLSFGFVSTHTSKTSSEANELLLAFPLGWEKAYTLDYRAQIRPYLVVQPTVQYFNTIGGNPYRPSGLVIGLHTGLRF